MPAVKVGRQWRFSISDVREWLRMPPTVQSPDRPLRSTPEFSENGLQPPMPACALRCSGTRISDLTAREQEVLALIGQGKGSKEIAALMSVTHTTVSEYRKRICVRLGLHSTAELAACSVGHRSGICRQARRSGR